ncbi:DUF2975 domain-containing protein [Pseudomonas weihenstephanensis]|uniref:Membrane protein n=1 Tax=Pseudomonas weihenstephanensis TaxID=1608994 RepID=A0A0J6IVT5_9PSED|nr:DUF2975 domain-containing protein [Pseudomonas weihenstephanensis]KMN12747.1 membrane protein [Pseudomonas weihenstephanensis]KMN16182.1 membrane protein [Pseudomonas weihenstephanensis]MBM1189296.1 DUF2975 domain-containing protein [Pseudomonas weihenstephanensis]
MNTDRLAKYSNMLATATLILIALMLLSNIAYWLFPQVMNVYGPGFNLTALTDSLDAKTQYMPWWQVAGGIILSSIPLLILAKGLVALSALFKLYAEGEYFAPESAQLLGKVGKSVGLWVLISFVLGPVLSVWITFMRPQGERLFTISFGPSDLVALFLAASVMIVARSLHRACVLARENQQFV